MIPLQVTAILTSAAIPAGGPILLDGILSAGLGGEMGSQRADKWADPAEVAEVIHSGSLPLARVEVGQDWWYCASQANPTGREELRHLHKRIPQNLLERYTTARNINIATGPDKSLRLPQYLRPEWMAPTWTCVGDPDRIASLLWRVAGLGKMTTHGNGWVREWRLSTGHIVTPFLGITHGPAQSLDLPAPSEYARNLDLRHLPVEAVPSLPTGRLQRRTLPLRPPYHTGHDPDASRARLCWQRPA